MIEYSAPVSADAEEIAGLMAGIGFMWIFCIAVLAFVLYCRVRIFQKIGYKGWYALCPYYSSWLLFKAVWGDGWKALLMWIPFYNIYLAIKTNIGLAKAFDHGVGFGIGLIFLDPIFEGILALGKSEYVGNPYSA